MAKKHSILNFIHFADILSLFNGIAGLASIYFSLNGKYIVAFSLIVVAGIFDLLDGKVARKLNAASEFGREIDSLCDLISFVISPVIFAYSLGFSSLWYLLILSFFVISGILRLSRFNVIGTLKKSKGQYYEGLPVTFSILLIALYFAFKSSQITLDLWLILYLIQAILMVSTLRIRKF
jgi:CDP-diacylglycerol--serine O-phosphatidyltransferase